MPGNGINVNLRKAYRNTNYSITISANSNTSGWPISYARADFYKTVNAFNMDGTGNLGGTERTIWFTWMTAGYC